MSYELSNLNILIFGLGLMGGSIALAIKDKCKQLIAIDPDPHVHKLALEKKIVDEVFVEFPAIEIKADLIILAAPISANIRIIEILAEKYPYPAVVLDISSTKQMICEVMQNLPVRFDPIGGHPICGKEKMSLDYADALLYAGNIFVLTPLQRTTSFAKQIALELVESLQSIPYWIDAATHDRWIANTSHLPYIISNILAGTTPEDVHQLIGPGFRSTTRLAESNLNMMMDIIATNKNNILEALNNFLLSMDHVNTALLNDDFQQLAELFQLGLEKRINLNQPFDFE